MAPNLKNGERTMELQKDQKFESFNVLVSKEFEIKESGERKTSWHKVGRAWKSKNGSSLNFELFLIPNQRFVISLETEKFSDQPKQTR